MELLFRSHVSWPAAEQQKFSENCQQPEQLSSCLQSGNGPLEYKAVAPAIHLHLLIDFLKGQGFTFLLDEESPYTRSTSRAVFGTDILTLHVTSNSTSLLGFVLLKPEMKDIPGHTVNFLFFVSLV